jgi:N-acylglucosamine-6-phosphate 2-epimerase
VIAKLKHGLIVSCQAADSSPLNEPKIIAALALAVQQQGAVGVRVNGSRNIGAVRKAVTIPIIGIEKRSLENFPVYITPTFASLRRVARAGADIVALDCTRRPRPKGQSLPEIIARARRESNAPLMADVATVSDGLQAADLGVDLIATTLYGYTEETLNARGPAFRLLRSLVRENRLPVVVEGRLHKPDDVKRAFDLGAFAVVVGAAITGVEWLVQRFAAATPRAERNQGA